ARNTKKDSKAGSQHASARSSITVRDVQRQADAAPSRGLQSLRRIQKLADHPTPCTFLIQSFSIVQCSCRQKETNRIGSRISSPASSRNRIPGVSSERLPHRTRPGYLPT